MEKPKVRFSHSSENTVDKAIPKKVNEIQEKGKIKVKSIVPINLPITVLKNGRRLILKNHENTNNVQIITEQTLQGKSNSQHTNDGMPFSQSNVAIPSTCISKTSDSCTETDSQPVVISRSETPISLTPANYIHHAKDSLDQSNKYDSEVQNCTDQLQGVTISETDKGFSKASSLNRNQIHQKICNPNLNTLTEKRVQYTHCNGSDYDEEVEIIDIINRRQFRQGSKNRIKPDNQVHSTGLTPEYEDKENDNKNHHETLHKIKSATNTDILKDATCASFNKNMKSAKKPVKVQRKLQVMPCAKFKLVPSVNKHADKQFKSRVKTRSCFNIAGKANNILVQPEISNASHPEHLHCNLKKSCKTRDITSKNLLSHPEYNSTVSVMKKMKEIGEEKWIKDVESLPATYKSLVHGKVSAALDFAPYESVYKNLINLSVNNDELPAILTRTKDPEPRDKDITPSLHNFYKPKSTQEHFMSLDPQIFNPISVNTLSAFTISNKICTWRISRDSF